MKCPFVCRVVICLYAIALLGLTGSAGAGLITTDPSLPPPAGVYASGAGGQITYNVPGFGPIVLSDISLTGFTGIVHTNVPPDEREQYNATLTGTATAGASTFPFSSSGPVTTMAYGKSGQVTGTFQTEMLQLSLSGTTPLGSAMIRESPTLASTGQTTIADVGGGLFRIDSFFDVFTELSVDGGATWIPAQGTATPLTLLPEPGVLSLLGFAALGLLGRRRRA
ncbi:MAG: PEP-CTERM sorting domain-containing protein [Tepidisphaerales bacterium]